MGVWAQILGQIASGVNQLTAPIVSFGWTLRPLARRIGQVNVALGGDGDAVRLA